jgi:hypothetical protein
VWCVKDSSVFIDGSVKKTVVTNDSDRSVALVSTVVCWLVQSKFARWYGSAVCLGVTQVSCVCAR